MSDFNQKFISILSGWSPVSTEPINLSYLTWNLSTNHLFSTKHTYLALLYTSYKQKTKNLPSTSHWERFMIINYKAALNLELVIKDWWSYSHSNSALPQCCRLQWGCRKSGGAQPRSVYLRRPSEPSLPGSAWKYFSSSNWLGLKYLESRQFRFPH